MKRFVQTHRLCMILLTLMIFVLVQGCAPRHLSPVEKTTFTTYKTLKTAKIFREEGLSAAGLYYKRGLIDEEKKEEIIKLGDDLQQGINDASEALELFKATGEETNLAKKMEMYHYLYGKFTDLVMPLVLEKL